MRSFRKRLTLALATCATVATLGAATQANAQYYGPPPPPGWAGPHYYWHGRHWHHRAWAWDRRHARRHWRYY